MGDSSTAGYGQCHATVTKKQSDIDEAINALRKTSELEVTVEDDVAGFLGVMIKRYNDGRIEFTQKGLIERVITALDLKDRTSSYTSNLPYGVQDGP